MPQPAIPAAISTAPAWQRERALLLHRHFTEVERSAAAGERISSRMAELAAALDGAEVGGRALKASEKTLWRLLGEWRTGGRTAGALIPRYCSAGSARPMPDALKAEIQRRASHQRGGRDKHGRANDAAVYQQLVRDWRAGKEIKGLGTWQDWWADDERTRGLDLPASAPDFPWCERTVRRHSGSRALKAAGNIGKAEAMRYLPRVDMDYSRLRKCELYTLDDARLDLAAINDATGQPCEVYAYILIEVASRMIVNVMLKTEKHVRQEDVAEVLAYGLSAPGFGIGVGYATHIKFERGTVACSEATQAILEGGSGGRIVVHRTGMHGGIRWVGSSADRASGNAAGKAVVESFIGRLHSRLSHLPGQRGNNAANSPTHLGIEDRLKPGAGRDTDGAARTLVREARQLAAIRLESLRTTGGSKIELPLLLFSQVRTEVQNAIEHYNAEAGHDYQGHGSRTEAEVAPGVWAKL
jgi:hypothetical protein